MIVFETFPCFFKSFYIRFPSSKFYSLKINRIRKATLSNDISKYLMSFKNNFHYLIILQI